VRSAINGLREGGGSSLGLSFLGVFGQTGLTGFGLWDLLGWSYYLYSRLSLAIGFVVEEEDVT